MTSYQTLLNSSSDTGDQGALLTGVNFNGYGPPEGFCFDIKCSDYIQVTNIRIKY